MLSTRCALSWAASRRSTTPVQRRNIAVQSLRIDFTLFGGYRHHGFQGRSGAGGNHRPVRGAEPQETLPVDNLPNQSIAAVAFAVDVDGNRSFQYLAQTREIFQFGGAGSSAAAFQGQIALTIDGTLAIASDQAPLASLNASATVLAVTVSVKQAPTGANITAALYVGGVLWLTLIILAGTTTVSATPSQIAGLTAIAAASNVRLDLTTVGTTSPGSDLLAQIFY